MAETEPEQLPEMDPTAQLLIQVAQRLNRLNGKVLGSLDVPLTLRQHRILFRVSQGHTSLATLAAFGNLTLPTVSESVEVLVRRGLLTRQANPADRRVVDVQLTPAGRAAAIAGQQGLGEINERLVSGVPEQARRLLHESLSSIYDAATAYFQEQPSDGVPSAKKQKR